MNLTFSSLVVGTTLCAWVGADAQPYSLEGYTFNGGGVGVGGLFSLHGANGQSDAGASAGGGFTLTGGFGSVFSIPVAPVLSVRPVDAGGWRISWPSTWNGWALQQSADLNSPHWTAASEQVMDDGFSRSIRVNPLERQHFYRLVKP